MLRVVRVFNPTKAPPIHPALDLSYQCTCRALVSPYQTSFWTVLPTLVHHSEWISNLYPLFQGSYETSPLSWFGEPNLLAALNIFEYQILADLLYLVTNHLNTRMNSLTVWFPVMSVWIALVRRLVNIKNMFTFPFKVQICAYSIIFFPRFFLVVWK